jgi:hypothetical protein
VAAAANKALSGHGTALNSAWIERYVPSLPLSREVDKLEQLKRSLAVYRFAFDSEAS